MDVIIFGGQSNMQGQTEGLPIVNERVDGALEYKFRTDEFVSLKHPVGENIGEWILQANGGGGSLVPAFCRAYVKETGREVIAVHAAKGNTTLAEWLQGTQSYHTARKKICAGLKKARENFYVERVYYVWLQGESDSIIATTQEEYANRLITYKNLLKKDVGIEKFGIIRVGYFTSLVTWLKDERSHERRAKCDEAIMRAQEQAVESDGDFIMLTDKLASMSLDKRFINPFAEGHFNNVAMEIIGETAGRNLALFSKNKKFEA